MNDSNEVYKYYLQDLAVLVKEEALAAKKEREQYRGTSDEGYYIGKLIAWHTIVSLMQQQAAGLDMPISEIKLDDINPERDLL